MIEPRLGDDVHYIKKKLDMVTREQESVPFDSMCDEIFLWIHKILRDWHRALEQKYNTE